jgi:hypothetical protein
MKCRVIKIIFLTNLKVGLFVKGKLVLLYFTLKLNVQDFSPLIKERLFIGISRK